MAESIHCNLAIERFRIGYGATMSRSSSQYESESSQYESESESESKYNHVQYENNCKYMCKYENKYETDQCIFE